MFALEKFVSDDVFRRIYLDIGKTIQSKAPNIAIGLSRLKEIKDYVKETVAESFRNNTQKGMPIASSKIREMVNITIQETFDVFEEYAE